MAAKYAEVEHFVRFSRATRNRYERKIADFVVCTQAFGAIAVVELDDASHDGREEQDAQRDSFLSSAGYAVFRYRTIPELSKLRQDITPDVIKFDRPEPQGSPEIA